jgi:hypothetical protein
LRLLKEPPLLEPPLLPLKPPELPLLMLREDVGTNLLLLKGLLKPLGPLLLTLKEGVDSR